MSKMKYSGVEWIGDIPKYWNIDKLKYCVNEINSGGTPESSNMDYYDDANGIPWVAIGDMSTKEYVYNTSKKLTLEGIKNKNLKIYPSGTLLYSIFATIGKTSFLKINATINQAILAIIPNKKIDKLYLKYQLNAMEDYVLSECSTNTQNNLNSTKVKNFNLILPKLNEQKLIANFLDEKVSNLDNILSDLNKQIEILINYKKSIITETIKSGLEKDANYVDSNHEWIGQINSTAKLIRLKNYSYLKGRIGWQGLTADEFIDEGPYCVTGTDFINGKINWQTCYHISEKRYKMDYNIHLKVGDLLVTKDGTIGKLAKVNFLPDRACLNSHLLIIRPLTNEYTNEYLFYVMSSDIFKEYAKILANGSTMDSLSQEKIGNFIFPSYELKKQKEIVDYLDKKCEQIDKIIDEKKKQVEKIEEYKKSVIYEYVTGKKRVEGAEELYG